MIFMFSFARSFNQSLEKWDLSRAKHYSSMFEFSGLSKANWKKMKKNKSWTEKVKDLGLQEGY